MYEIFNNSNVVELITTDPAWTHGRREGKEREWLQTASQSSSIRTPALNQLLQKSLSFCQVQQKCRKTCLEKKNEYQSKSHKCRARKGQNVYRMQQSATAVVHQLGNRSCFGPKIIYTSFILLRNSLLLAAEYFSFWKVWMVIT